MVDVNVIIVNYKMKDSVRGALATLFSDMSGTPLSIKVTVIDNASEDGVGEMLEREFSQVLFLQNGQNLGFGAANNNAIRAVASRYYFFLNPDTRFVEPKTIERLFAFMESKPAAGICAPRLVNFDGSLQHSCFRFPTLFMPIDRRTAMGQTSAGAKRLDRFLMRKWEHDKRRMVDWVMGSAMFIRGSALAALGVMDSRFFMYFEDTDLCRRFWQKHWPVYYLSDVSLAHAHHRDSAELPVWKGFFLKKTTRYHVVSWLKYLGKYGLKDF
jgi:GT2 family glycosyltransferase